MNPQTVSQPEPKAAGRWSAVKPITQGELIDAAHAALRAVPAADNRTLEAENYAARLRLAGFVGYIGADRPKLAAELRKLMNFDGAAS